MRIRQIQKNDLPELSELYKGFWNEESNLEEMHKAYDRIRSNPSYIVLNAFDEGKLIGSIMGVICDELYGDCRPFMVIEDLIVDNKYRRQGIGKALLQALENEARNKNCAQAILVTEENREDAISFYESQGYEKDMHKGYKKKMVKK